MGSLMFLNKQLIGFRRKTQLYLYFDAKQLSKRLKLLCQGFQVEFLEETNILLLLKNSLKKQLQSQQISIHHTTIPKVLAICQQQFLESSNIDPFKYSQDSHNKHKLCTLHYLSIINKISMLSQKIVKNEYFNVDHPPSFLQDHSREDTPISSYSEIKTPSKNNSYNILPSPRNQESKSMLIHKKKCTRIKSGSPSHHDNQLFSAFKGLKVLNLIKENRLLAKQSKGRVLAQTPFPKTSLTKPNQEYFEKNGTKEDKKRTRNQNQNKFKNSNIKKSFSYIKTQRVKEKIQQQSYSKLNNKKNTKNFHLPMISRLHDNRTTDLLVKSKSSSSPKQVQYHKILSSRVKSDRQPNIELFKRSKSIKLQKGAYNKLLSVKLKTQQNKPSVQQRIDNLNQTLSEIRHLNQIHGNTHRLFYEHLNCASSLLDVQYNNILFMRQKR